MAKYFDPVDLALSPDTRFAIEVGPIIILINTEGEGVVVDLWADRLDEPEPLGSTWVMYAEAEEDEEDSP